ncbi:superfamily I DNA/RNA helicase [Bacillus ectoiniformans]|uniref:UvrD-helicase domain-containing protein n=1 Tax=Bacillus ectoiniformans TaxID=1494429 RepID=UPI00195D2382|nr:UvrD-helicase domain-containing protein [Bacillus ectoiniformans]MBM7650508.1 superfamily I DNA/RNA helicase [Bacillus ectoiniformans]
MLPVDIDIRDQILNIDGNIVVSASAGTGKTYTTVKRIIQDVNSVSNYQTFAAITFTRKAAKEIKDRLGVNKGTGFIGTNDNFVLKEIIQPFMYDVYGSEFKKEIFPDFSNRNTIKKFNEGVSKIKENGYLCKYDNNHKNFAFQLGLDILKKSISARRYLRSKYFRLYIDEYQDCDVDMHSLFIYISDNLKIPLFLVGDIKQSIYGWRGAYSEGFKYLMKRDDFNTFNLWHNFRSNQSIQNYSNIFMEEARNNYNVCEFKNEVQLIVYTNEVDAIEYIENWLNRDQKCSFLNFRRDTAEDWSNLLKEREIDFVYLPHSPLDNGDLESEHVWIARMLASYLLEDRYNEYDVLLEIPMPEAYEIRKIRSLLLKVTQNLVDKDEFYNSCLEFYKYLGYCDVNNKMSNEIGILYTVISDPKYIPYYNAEKYKLTTSTIHSSKGLEFEQVIINGNEYNFNSDNDRYLHYVAVSRPKNRLLILLKNNFSGKKYLKEIDNVVSETQNIGYKIKTSDVIEFIDLMEIKQKVPHTN